MWGWHLPSFDLSILSFGPSTASPVIVADLFFYLWWISWHLGKWKCQVQYTIFWCNLLWPSPPPKKKRFWSRLVFYGVTAPVWNDGFEVILLYQLVSCQSSWLTTNAQIYHDFIMMPLETNLFRKGRIRTLPTPSNQNWCDLDHGQGCGSGEVPTTCFLVSGCWQRNATGT